MVIRIQRLRPRCTQYVRVFRTKRIPPLISRVNLYWICDKFVNTDFYEFGAPSIQHNPHVNIYWIRGKSVNTDFYEFVTPLNPAQPSRQHLLDTWQTCQHRFLRIRCAPSIQHNAHVNIYWIRGKSVNMEFYTIFTESLGSSAGAK